MNDINKKIMNALYSDEDIALNLYNSLDIKPFDYFYYEDHLDNITISNDNAFFFMAHQCYSDTIVRKMWENNKVEIINNLSIMTATEIVKKICKEVILNKNDKKTAFLFSMKEIFKFYPKKDIKILKNEIIKFLLKTTEEDLFLQLIECNIFNEKDFINFVSYNEGKNNTIIKILNKYKKIDKLSMITLLDRVNNSFNEEISHNCLGDNIEIKNDLSSIKALLEIEQDEIILNKNESDLLMKVARYFKDHKLFSIVNKIIIKNILPSYCQNNEKIFRVRL